MTHQSWLRTASWTALLVAVACSGSSGTGGNSQGTSGSANGSSGSAAASGTNGASGAGGTGTTSSGVGGGSGTIAASGVGGGGSGTVATTGAGGGSGVGGGSGISGTSGLGVSGATGSSGGTGASSGASGTGASSGAGASSGSNVPSTSRHGMSKGCGSAPVGAVSTGYTDHIINIPACPGTCVPDGGAPAAGPPSYPDCIDPCFAVGGPSYKANGGESALKRDYTIELPANYNPATPYPLFLGGGGCGGNPPQNGAGFSVGATGAITIGLQYVNGCFADGGSACSGPQNLEPSCVRGPELPYIRAILAEVEAGFCV